MGAGFRKITWDLPSPIPSPAPRSPLPLQVQSVRAKGLGLWEGAREVRTCVHGLARMECAGPAETRCSFRRPHVSAQQEGPGGPRSQPPSWLGKWLNNRATRGTVPGCACACVWCAYMVGCVCGEGVWGGVGACGGKCV